MTGRCGIIVTLAVTCSAVLFTGCSNIPRGEVVGKKYIPASEQSAPGISGRAMMKTLRYPERWVILISTGKEDGWCDVSKKVWHDTKIGDRFECAKK